jgi:excisionase family DNA binding protein
MVKKPLVRPDEQGPEPDQLLNIAQVARMLNVSRTLIYWLIQRGDLPTLHIGHALRFRPQDVADYLQKRSVPPAPKSASKTTQSKPRLKKG